MSDDGTWFAWALGVVDQAGPGPEGLVEHRDVAGEVVSGG